MPDAILGYLEIADKRTFAGALDWPGWCRSGRTEAEAIEALIAYGPRYAKALAGSDIRFELPADASAILVVERLAGNATTEFGAPGIAPSSDNEQVTGSELERQIGLLQAAWRALDTAAEAVRGVELRKGPRGGGRDLDKIVAHIVEAERAYLHELGGTAPRLDGADVDQRLLALREAVIETLRARATGHEPAKGPRRKNPFWSPRYFIRRTAWHALDHAWEIEDRAS
jgi:DinB superfamily